MFWTSHVKPNLIETMLAGSDGRIALWDLHMDRLTRSAHVLGFKMPAQSQIAQCVATAIAESAQLLSGQTPAWRVRLLLDSQGCIEATAQVLAPLPVIQKVAVSRHRLHSGDPWLRHKSTHRPWYTEATEWLQHHPDYFDVLFLNERDELCEGTRSNVYININDQWLTPPVDCGLLPGTLRRQLLQDNKAVEAVIQAREIRPGMQIRLSNGLRGWFDVTPDLQTEAG